MDGLLCLTLKQHRKFLIILFFISLALRLMFFYAFLRNNPMQLAFDSGHYNDVATALAQGKGFTNADGTPHFYRLPGYPLFVAGCYILCGINVERALMVQLLLASIIPLLIFIFCMVLFPAAVPAAKIVASISAVHCGFLTFSGLVMSETLFVFFFLLFLIFFLITMQRPCWASSVSAGIFLGVTSLIRPVGIWILLASITFIVFKQWCWDERIRQAIYLSVSCLSIIGAWLMRNFMLTGALFLHTLSGPHFLNHGAVRVRMYTDGISYQQAQREVYREYGIVMQQSAQQKKRPLCEHECSAIAERYAITVMLQHPLQTAKLCVVNMIKTMCSLYSSELLFIDSAGYLPPYDAQRSWTAMVLRFVWPTVNNRGLLFIIYLEIFMHVLMLIGIAGWFIAAMLRRRKYNSEIWYLYCVSALFIGLSCICGFARLRLPIEPFFIMLAVIFWMNGATGKRVG